MFFSLLNSVIVIWHKSIYTLRQRVPIKRSFLSLEVLHFLLRTIYIMLTQFVPFTIYYNQQLILDHSFSPTVTGVIFVIHVTHHESYHMYTYLTWEQVGYIRSHCPPPHQLGMMLSYMQFVHPNTHPIIYIFFYFMYNQNYLGPKLRINRLHSLNI